MDRIIPFGTPDYFVLLVALVFARAMDFLSTWIATPNLVLEGNPIARKLGWKWGIGLNGAICVFGARWPLLAVILITTSLLVAARNFPSAWLMRSLGEERFRIWMTQRLAHAGAGLYVGCILAQALLTGTVGFILISFSEWKLIPFAVGSGIVTYSVTVTLFTLLSVWRLPRHPTADGSS